MKDDKNTEEDEDEEEDTEEDDKSSNKTDDEEFDDDTSLRELTEKVKEMYWGKLQFSKAQEALEGNTTQAFRMIGTDLCPFGSVESLSVYICI